MEKLTVPPFNVVSVPKFPHDVMPEPIFSVLEVHVPVEALEANVASDIYGNADELVELEDI